MLPTIGVWRTSSTTLSLPSQSFCPIRLSNGAQDLPASKGRPFIMRERYGDLSPEIRMTVAIPLQVVV
jgi:hypothetical protein